MLGNQNLDVMLGVVNVSNHRHDAGDVATLGDRLGHEDGHVSVTREIARTADAVHHLGAAHVSGVDVAIDVELERGVDTDDAKTAHKLRMVGDFLRTQDQLVLVLLQVAEHAIIATLGQGDGATGSKGHLARIDQLEGAVLQYFGVHHQVFERRIDQTAHHCVGDVADTDLHRAEVLRHTAGFDLALEELDQMVGDGLGFFVRRSDRGVGIRLIGDDDGGNLGRIDRDRSRAETIIDLGQRDRAAVRALTREVDVVQTFQVQVVCQVQLDDHLVGEHGQVGRVAY